MTVTPLEWVLGRDRETLFIIPYATLHNYPNTLMHKNEPKVNPTLINHVIMEYELRAGTT